MEQHILRIWSSMSSFSETTLVTIESESRSEFLGFAVASNRWSEGTTYRVGNASIAATWSFSIQRSQNHDRTFASQWQNEEFEVRRVCNHRRARSGRSLRARRECVKDS